MAVMIENYANLKLYEKHTKDYCQDEMDMIIESEKGEFVIKNRVCLLLREEKIMHFLIATRLYFLCFKGSDEESKE